MASHYKIYLNDSEPNDFCFMPSINISTLGYINQTLKRPQPEHLVTGFALAFNMIVCLSGLTINSLIVTVLMKNTMLKKETLTPAILSLISANIFYCIVAIVWLLSGDSDVFRCKFVSASAYILMLCSVFNLLGIGILRIIRLYLWKNSNEKRFRMVCIFVALFAWFGAFIVSFPTAIGHWGQVAIECNTRACMIINVNMDGSNTGNDITKIYCASYIFFGIFNIVLNFAIYFKIHKNLKTIATEIGTYNKDLAMDFMKRERKAAKMMGADSVLYAFFPIPRAVLFIIEPFAYFTVSSVAKVTFTLWGLTAILEPILLLIFQEKYRIEIKDIFKGTYSSVKEKLTPAPSTQNTAVMN